MQLVAGEAVLQEGFSHLACFLLIPWLLQEADLPESFRPSLDCALQQLSFQGNLVGCKCEQAALSSWGIQPGCWTTGRHSSGFSASTAWNHLAILVLQYFVPPKFTHLLLNGSNSDFLMKNFCGRWLVCREAPVFIFHDKWEFCIQRSWDLEAAFQQHNANMFGG